MDWSIIIPTYNRAEILSKTLQALHELKIPANLKFEVIVIDDGSTQNNQHVIEKNKSLSKFQLHYHYQQNQGQGIARNTGLEIASGQKILLIGDDIIPDPNLLSEHERSHQIHPEKDSACLGLIKWHPEMNLTPFMQWLVGDLTFFGRFGGHQFAFNHLKNKTVANFNYFYTSNISFKSALIKKYKFDPDFKSYGWEDIELGYRLEKNENLTLYFNPAAIGYHHHQLELESLKKRMFMIGKSARIFNQKHPELKKVPAFWKQFILRLLALNTSLFMLKKLNNPALYYYALSKKYFLEGLKASRQFANK